MRLRVMKAAPPALLGLCGLPPELLPPVLAYLRPRDALHLAKTCRAMYAPCSARVLRDIVVTGREAPSAVERLVDCGLRNGRHALVRSLELHVGVPTYPFSDSEDMVRLVFVLARNLEGLLLRPHLSLPRELLEACGSLLRLRTLRLRCGRYGFDATLSNWVFDLPALEVFDLDAWELGGATVCSLLKRVAGCPSLRSFSLARLSAEAASAVASLAQEIPDLFSKLDMLENPPLSLLAFLRPRRLSIPDSHHLASLPPPALDLVVHLSFGELHTRDLLARLPPRLRSISADRTVYNARKSPRGATLADLRRALGEASGPGKVLAVSLAESRGAGRDNGGVQGELALWRSLEHVRFSTHPPIGP